MPSRLLVASNRGPVSFSRTPEGQLHLRRGGGGLVSGLSSALGGTDAVWVCAALSEEDRRAALGAQAGRLDTAYDTGGLAVRMLAIDPLTFRRAYSSVANSTLWFVHHMLFETPRKPVFDADFRRQWMAYVAYDRAFADALAAEAEPGAAVLVQDYHLFLTPRQLRAQRPDLRIAHFSHTPWAPPEYFALLPPAVRREVLLGVLGADSAGFLSRRWAAAFLDCCRQFLPEAVVEPVTPGSAEVGTGAAGTAEVGTVELDGRRTTVRVHPLGVDAAGLRARAGQPDVSARLAELRELIGPCRMLLRIDRTELSKNIVRGLLAYRELLRTHPGWIGRVVHLVLAYPSRHDLPEYREYTSTVQRVGREIEDEFATADWAPLHLLVVDDYPGSLAAFRLAEVLVVNPIRDGMNLVAEEGPVLSDRGVALVLSTEAGAADVLGEHALLVSPYDVSETAEAMHTALLLSPTERAARCERLAAAATALPPAGWFAEQVHALGGA